MYIRPLTKILPMLGNGFGSQSMIIGLKDCHLVLEKAYDRVPRYAYDRFESKGCSMFMASTISHGLSALGEGMYLGVTFICSHVQGHQDMTRFHIS